MKFLHISFKLRSKQQAWNNLETTFGFSQIVGTRKGNSLVWHFKSKLIGSPVMVWKYVRDALPNVPVISRYHSLLATSKQIEAYHGLHLPEGVLSYHDETRVYTTQPGSEYYTPCLSLPAVVAYVTSLPFLYLSGRKARPVPLMGNCPRQDRRKHYFCTTLCKTDNIEQLMAIGFNRATD